MAVSEDGKRARRASWKASKLAFASRVLLGPLLISGGVNNFLARNPVPNPTPEGDHFLGLLQETGYMLPAVAITEIGAGVLLLSGYFVPLALAVLAPIMVNILLFHVFLQLAGIEAAVVAAVFYLHLLYVHRSSFTSVLAP